MDTLIHADIFFFVTTIIVVLIAIPAIIIAFYLIKIVRDISEVTEKVKGESIEIIDDVKALRGDIKREGFKVRNLLSLFTIFSKRRKSKSRVKQDD